MVELSTGGLVGMIIGIVIGVALITALITFLLARKMFEKQIKENPPVSEKMIRVMFKQMGRTASETQIRQIMRSMQNAKYQKDK
ncbi:MULTISPECIES: YneF family protein [unclassified Mycoplasma]|uniref:YneF family protein n=1 Tax=unclassified Mycoplasma TaxID=2683645 RepID=UPI00211BEDE5|nr:MULTISPECIES: YneF family protein [unclassified Mycoplasma]UUM20095.1 YneF family protein [Mycoplasma sp. 1578d]UUM25075.1 YneF family protein [Mycoplasma sp. 3686d]